VSELPQKAGPARDPRATVVEDEAGLTPHLPAWDALAVACERPFCAPAWLLAWWREAREGDARLRVVLVFDGERLIGVGPFFAQVAYGLNELRLLSAGFSHRIGPLAEPGREAEVAAAMAPAMAAIEPPPASVVFEGIDAGDEWPDLLAAAWPGKRRPRQRIDATMEAPSIDLGGSYEEWLERRPRKFRKESRRNARRLEEAGVSERISSDPEAVKALLRLHGARWEERGGSDIGPEAEKVVVAAARELGADRLQVVLLQGPEGPIAAELMLRAGATAAFWAGGFDPAWSRQAPGTQTMLVALRDAAAGGIRVADLGGGAHPYKLRMADSGQPIVWRTLFPRGRLYWRIRLRLAPKHSKQLARRLAARLPEPLRERLRRH
jgi:CelD/BcsL family acetyltransferase involved in cellulose biosynthesis